MSRQHKKEDRKRFVGEERISVGVLVLRKGFGYSKQKRRRKGGSEMRREGNFALIIDLPSQFVWEWNCAKLCGSEGKICSLNFERDRIERGDDQQQRRQQMKQKSESFYWAIFSLQPEMNHLEIIKRGEIIIRNNENFPFSFLLTKKNFTKRITWCRGGSKIRREKRRTSVGRRKKGFGVSRAKDESSQKRFKFSFLRMWKWCNNYHYLINLLYGKPRKDHFAIEPFQKARKNFSLWKIAEREKLNQIR